MIKVEVTHIIKFEDHCQPDLPNDLVHKLFSKIDSLTLKIDHFMSANDDKLQAISDQLDSVSGKVDAQNTAITAAKTSLDGIKADVADLKKQIANSGLAGAKLDELKQKAQNIEDKVDAGTSALAAVATEASDLDAETNEDPTGPTLTDTAYTGVNGEAIVVSQAGAAPAAGEKVTVNGAAVTTDTTLTLSDGAVLVLSADSVVVSYSPAQG